MSRSRSLVRNQSSRLLKALLNNPSLPAYIPQLEAPVLNRLVEQLGAEDAGALVVYATNQQLRSIFDESLWASLAPGGPEVHRPEEFVRWLLVLAEQGEALLAEKLAGLGSDYVAMNLATLVEVRGSDSIVRSDRTRLEEAEEYQGCYVSPIYYEEWDITRTALVALDEYEPELLEQILLRLQSGGGELLMADLSGERRDRKEGEGYVSPESATALLQLIRITDLQALIVGDSMDPVSTWYFSQLGTMAPENSDTDADSDAVSDLEDTVDAGKTGSETQESRSADFAALGELLVEAEIVSTTTPLMLGGPDDASSDSTGSEELAIKRLVDDWQANNPAMFSLALGQLVYLSNVLISGTSLQGRRFDQVEAAHAALSVCNLGLSLLVKNLGQGSRGGLPGGREEPLFEMGEAGLVQLFRIGWKLMLETPLHVAALLKETLGAATFTQRLYDKQWIVDELSLTLDELQNLVRARNYEDVKDNLVFLSLVIDKSMTDALLLVLSDYPRFPFAEEARFLNSTEDLMEIDRYVRNLGYPE